MKNKMLEQTLCKGAFAHMGQVMELYGSIKKGEFDLQLILFMPEDVEMLRSNCITLFDNDANNIPVFIPIRENGRQQHRIRMERSIDRIINQLIYIITQKREMYLLDNMLVSAMSFPIGLN